MAFSAGRAGVNNAAKTMGSVFIHNIMYIRIIDVIFLLFFFYFIFFGGGGGGGGGGDIT